MLALVLAVLQWRHYLLGQKFVTDQRSLKYLWEQKITTLVHKKWLVRVMGYDFVILYKAGKENVVVDALSRREEQGELLALSTPFPRWLTTIQEEVAANSKLQKMAQNIQQGQAMGPWGYKEGVIFFKNKIFLLKDSPSIPMIMNQFHSSTHEGYHKTIHRVKSVFYWSTMCEDVNAQVRQCETC